MEREARRRFCFRTGAAIRKAATDSTWRARQRGPEQKLPDPPQQPKGPAAALAGDRGSWVGPSVGSAAIRERQAYRHQANLTSAVLTKQRTEAAVAEAARVIATAAATQAQGSFDRVLLVRGGGGRLIAAAGAARDNLANFDKQALQEASRAWATLPRWWTWSDERVSRAGHRFANLERLSEGVCRARQAGVQCGKAGFLSTDGLQWCKDCRIRNNSATLIH